LTHGTILLHDILEFSGFTVNEIGLHPQIISLQNGLYEWLRLFLCESVLGGFSDAEAGEILKLYVSRIARMRGVVGH